MNKTLLQKLQNLIENFIADNLSFQFVIWKNVLFTESKRELY